MRTCSSADLGGIQGTDSPPWSPRRVPPAHLWGEGPPRCPGYRCGGATLPGGSEGTAHPCNLFLIPTVTEHVCADSSISSSETWETGQRILFNLPARCLNMLLPHGRRCECSRLGESSLRAPGSAESACYVWPGTAAACAALLLSRHGPWSPAQLRAVRSRPIHSSTTGADDLIWQAERCWVPQELS